MSDLQTIPILRSPDLDATRGFYTEQLGFAAERTATTHLILRREGIELHVIPPDPGEENRPNPSTCYIRGAGIDALHDEFAARGVPGFRPFTHTPWGMFEFYVSDPFGVLLRFGRSDREGHPPKALSGGMMP